MSGEDLASLGITVDATGVAAAILKLDQLTVAGKTAEAQTISLSAATASLIETQRAGAAITAQQVQAVGGWAAAQKILTESIKTSATSLAAHTVATTSNTAAISASSIATENYIAMQAALTESTVAQAEIVVASNATMAQSLGALGSASAQSAAEQIVANEAVATSTSVNARAISESFVIMREASRGNFTRMAGSVTILATALGALYTVLIPVTIAAAALGFVFEVAKNQINSGADGTGDLTKNLGLTAAQLDRVKDKYVSLWDTVKAVGQVLVKDSGIGALGHAWQETWNFISMVTIDTLAGIVGSVIGSIRIIEEAWKGMPTAMGGAGSIAGIDFAKAFQSGLDDAKKGMDGFYADVAAQARKNAVERIEKEAGKSRVGKDGPLDSAERQISQLNSETAAQNKLNDSVLNNKAFVSQATHEQELYRQTAQKIAAINEDDKLSSAKKASVIAELIAAQKGYNATLIVWQSIVTHQSALNELQLMQRRIDLIGKSTLEQVRGNAELKAWQNGVERGFNNEQLEQYVADQVDIASATEILAEKQKAYNSQLSFAADMMKELDSSTQSAASGMADAFGKVGKSIGDMATALTGYAVKEADLARQQAEHDKNNKDDISEQLLLTRKKADADDQYYADTIAGAKNMFGEKTAAYKILSSVEGVYNAMRLANNLAQMASDIEGAAVKASTATVEVAADGAKTAAGVAAGAANIFSELGPWAFPVVGAMIAVMAGLGFGGGGSSSSSPIDIAKDRQATQGAGSVLGDATAKSDSIAKSLDLLSKNSNADLHYGDEMVSSLKAIENSIGSLTALLARQLQVGGLFNTASLGLGTSGGGGGILGALFGSSKTTTTLLDQGISIAATTVGNAIANGVSANAYQIVQNTKTSSSLFGLISSTKTTNATTNTPLSGDFTNQISDIIGGLRSTVLQAAKTLGVDGAASVIDSMSVSLGSLSFKDMTGSEIQDALSAVFSKLGDDMAAAITPAVSKLQQVGEGGLQTLSRLVNEYQAVDDAAKIVGFTFSQVGVDSLTVRDNLVQLSGGLEQFTSQAQFFAQNFLTSAEALAPIQKAVADEMSQLGYASLATKDQFVALVQSIDTSTDSGAALYAQLMNVAPAFVKVADAAAELANKELSMQITLLQDQGAATEALNLKRQQELAALDASLRPLQEQIYAQEDLNAAATAAGTALRAANDNYTKAESTFEAANAAYQNLVNPVVNTTAQLANAHSALTNAYQAESSALQSTITQFRGFATTLSAFKDTLLVGSLASGNILTQYATAKVVFQQTAALAKTGDATALGNLENVAQNFLTASQSATATRSQYDADRSTVLNALDEAIGAATGVADNAQRQLDALNASVAGLGVLNNSVLSVRDAIADLASAQAAQDAAQAVAIATAQSALEAARQARDAAYAAIPGHASGLGVVPYDGYLMRAHAGEAVLTKGQANDWRSGKSGSNDNNALTAQLLRLIAAQDERSRKQEYYNKQILDIARAVTQGGTSVKTST